MSYAEVTVIVDGALSSEEVTYGQLDLDKVIVEAEQDALADGLPTEIYILHHDHDEPDGEDCSCECIQYEQSHKPAYSWNLPT